MMRNYNQSSVFSLPRLQTRTLGWNIPADQLSYIPDHWLHYEEPDPVHHYMLAFLYFIFCFIALTGNGLVIWIFCSSKSLRTPSNIFVVNLAICDFLMFTKIPVFIYNSFYLGFAAGLPTACDIYGVIGTCSGIGASATNTCIAYDRYSTITRPLDGRLTTLKAVIMVTLAWMWTLPWAILPFLRVFGRFVPEGYLTSCSFDYLTDDTETKLFTGLIFVTAYVIPVSMVIYFYIQIVMHVFRHEQSLRDQAKKMNVESLRSSVSSQNESAELRIAKAAVIICFFFVLAWTPYAVVAMIGAFGNKELLTPFSAMAPALACKTVACIDPFIYAISHPKYRIELQKRIKWINLHEPAIPEKSEIASTLTDTTPANVPH